MKTFLTLVLCIAAPVSAWSQVVPVPAKHIPSPVLMELRALENQFDQSLGRDCAPERCVSKGCAYRDHAVVDMPRSTSLPGLGQPEGPGSVPTQEYLTEVRCEFAHEKSVSARDVQALVRRLEQRLSKGWLRVTVGRQILEPISASLGESPPPKPEPVAKAPVVAPVPPPPPAPPAKWDSGVAVRELWLSLLPHFAWMIALFLVTLVALVIIWALRRLGRESLEEKALMAQLAEAAPKDAAPVVEPSTVVDNKADVAEDPLFVANQRSLWDDRIAQAELAKDESVVAELLRQWLSSKDFALLAKAIFVFGDRLSLAFPSDGELAVHKVEFAEYLRTLDERQLPSDAEFFRKLNHHAISSSLLAQSDAEIYRSIREEFGSGGVAHLIKSLAPRQGALMFALVPSDFQHEVARSLSPQLRYQVAGHLLASNRISKEEQGHVFAALDAARAGLPLPPAPTPAGIADRGRAFNAAGALSVLLSDMEPSARRALLLGAVEQSGGVMPLWYQDILYPDMILRVPPELRGDLLLQVDVKGLAGYWSVQPPAWQENFIAGLAPTMQNALRAHQQFGSREHQIQMARLGHRELVAGVKHLVATGKISFPELVS